MRLATFARLFGAGSSMVRGRDDVTLRDESDVDACIANDSLYRSGAAARGATRPR